MTCVFSGEAHVFQLFGERGAYLERARGDAAAAGAHEHVILDLIHIRSFDLDPHERLRPT